MKYIKTLVCKLKISAKRLGKNIGEICQTGFAIVGGLITVVELSDIVGIAKVRDFFQQNFWWVLLGVAVISVVIKWDRLRYTVKITDSPDITITLRVCDALKNEGAVIIPTNSTFDTVMDDEFISEDSIHGQYQIRFFKNKISELDKKIKEGLTGKKCVELKDGRKYNHNRFPIGTVTRINEKNKRAYFLADSDIDPQGHPIDVDATDVSQSLTGLWYDLSRNGNCESYSIPLIGTGKARAKDVSRNEVVQQIILSFLAASKEHKITESLTICIHPRDFEKIDWDGLCEFLKYQSQYANVKPADTKPIGTAETTPAVITYEGEHDFEETDEIQMDSSFEQRTELSEREQMLVTLLTGNKLGMSDIAEAMGLSMVATKRLLIKLQDAGVILSEGTSRQRRFYAPGSPKE